jgi:hypothetical protein
MLKTLAGFATGIFVAQEYPNETPRIKPIL